MKINYIFESDKFNLRPINIDDSQLYFESMLTDEAKKGFMSVPNNLEEAKEEIKEKIDGMNLDKPTHESYAIEINGSYAGYVEFNDLHETHFEHRGNLGYCIHPKYYGQGITTQAVIILTDYVFNKYDYIVRLVGWCRDFNVASARVMEKAGYKHEGTLVKNKCKDGVFLNDMIFAKVR